MSSFKIDQIDSSENNPFDRQERIDWWSQKKISDAKIMVVGAGAIGNETLKNLALLGVKNIFIADLDTISISNLSRTVLFRKSDIGKKKAEVAAERTKELSLADDFRIDWFYGDIVWELGTGLYRFMDLVLGCLDNVETRFEVNRQCWLANKPWIDSGINQLGVQVTVYRPPELPCYECAASHEQKIAKRRRYSCDDFKKKMLEEEKIPTVQVASAIASAIQTQEAMKLICGQVVTPGKKIYYQGKLNYFDTNQLPINPNCPAHVTYPNVVALPYESNLLLEEFLEIVSKSDLSGDGSILDFNAYRSFVLSASCRVCGSEIPFYRPSFRIYDTDLICENCLAEGKSLMNSSPPSSEAKKIIVSEFGLGITNPKILKMSLHDLGVPFWPILAVRNKLDKYMYYELYGDKKLLLPNISTKQ